MIRRSVIRTGIAWIFFPFLVVYLIGCGCWEGVQMAISAARELRRFS